MILVAKWYNKWVRVYIEQPDPHGERHLVRLVDHGGYWFFSTAEMKKIRSDYLTLPFQAIEIFLANVQPKNGKHIVIIFLRDVPYFLLRHDDFILIRALLFRRVEPRGL